VFMKLLGVIGVGLALASTSATAQSYDIAEFRALMAQRHDRVVEILSQTFPTEYTATEKQIAQEYARTHNVTAALLSLKSFASEIQARHFYEIANAPDADLQAIADAKLAQYRMLRRLDPVVCSEIAEGHAVSPDQAAVLMQMPRDPGADTGYAQFHALKDAREHPVIHKPLGHDEQSAIVGRYLALGGSRQWIVASMTRDALGQLSPEVRCEGAIAWDQAADSMPGDITVRYWADAYRRMAHPN